MFSFFLLTASDPLGRAYFETEDAAAIGVQGDVGADHVAQSGLVPVYKEYS